jgi:DNA-binding NarL/FixJ family response regulator
MADDGAAGISVLLVDDQALLRKGFRMVLEEEDGIVVVGEASDGAQAIDLVARLGPDVVVMDVRMPGMDGIEATRAIVKRSPRSRVLILTTFDLDEYAFSALRLGASGFLLKDVPPAELVSAIRAVADGDAVVSPRITRRLLDEYASQLPDLGGGEGDPDPRLGQLTNRELEILVEVAKGLSNAEVAAALFVAEATVKTHLGRVLAKLGLRDRVQAVVFAYQVGLARTHPDE